VRPATVIYRTRNCELSQSSHPPFTSVRLTLSKRRSPLSRCVRLGTGLPDDKRTTQCSGQVFRLLTDAVEKVGSTLPERNNGIKTNNILNRCCVFASSLESMLLGKAPKIFFRQYRPIRDISVCAGCRWLWPHALFEWHLEGCAQPHYASSMPVIFLTQQRLIGSYLSQDARPSGTNCVRAVPRLLFVASLLAGTGGSSGYRLYRSFNRAITSRPSGASAAVFLR
jgi:hypothetical protein